MATLSNEIVELLGLSNEEFKDMIAWLYENRIGDAGLASILKSLLMEEIAK